MASRPVRALIIDNYDSFTHNLAQCLGCLTDVEPTVVTNDDARWRIEYLAGFDCVVISPGPGRPDRAADFGICADVLEAARVPVLGVCLGHQGICHLLGGRVIPAPEPVHGRASLVRHLGDELFSGIPSPFRAVRYHSLMVTDIPGDLQVIATTYDEIPMALRHRTRPIWGVQFHPESICAEHGQHLLANFVRLTEMAKPDTGRTGPLRQAMVTTELARQQEEPDARPVSLRVLAWDVTCHAEAEAVFDALYRDSEQSFWLDSGMRAGDAGRFSFMGDSAGPLARTVTADVNIGQVKVAGADGLTIYSGSFFDWLRQDLTSHAAEIPPLPFGFALGWVGYLGYELKAGTGGDNKYRTIRSQLRPGAHAVDCVKAAFPGGSMTGAPKVRTMRIIDEIEAGPRGIYSGAIGYFSLDGAADLAITIRTLVPLPGTVSFGVGGAIVAMSDPDEEYEETAVKAAPVLTLLRQFPERQSPANQRNEREQDCARQLSGAAGQHLPRRARRRKARSRRRFGGCARGRPVGGLVRDGGTPIASSAHLRAGAVAHFRGRKNTQGRRFAHQSRRAGLPARYRSDQGGEGNESTNP